MLTISQPCGLNSLQEDGISLAGRGDVTRYNLLPTADYSALKTTYTSMPSLPTSSTRVHHTRDWHQSLLNVHSEHGALRKLLGEQAAQSSVVSKLPTNSELGRPLKNLLVLSIGWMFYFMSFFSLRSLQSSINHVAGLGLASLACIYAGFLVGCLVTIPIVRRLGTRRILAAGLVCHIIYVAANIHPTFYTVIPSSTLAGFSQVLMWTAQGAYLIKLSKAGSARSSKSLNSTASVYFGVFFLFYSLAPVFGSLLTSVLMQTVAVPWDYVVNFSNQSVYDSNGTALEHFYEYNWSNHSYTTPDTPTKSCGLLFCHAELNNDELFVLPLQTRLIIFGAYVISMVLSFTIFTLFLDEPRDQTQMNPRYISQFKSLLKFVKNPKFHLLAPVIFYMGIQTSFHSGEITKAYVTCLYGMEMVGFAMAGFGCSAAISSFVTGYLKRYINRLAILSLGFLINAACLVVMGLWMPTEDNLVPVLVLICLWGFAEGIWITHINCATGLLFPDNIEAAYTAFQFIVALGLVVGYSVSQYLCMLSKLYAVGVFAVLGMTSFVILKWQISRERRMPVKC
ncbi:protein unc-93 homolog A-like [Liolophura sinensis]|uniref:protein unc-93 homolog A-like n=1 Tax=Liolophura sinensis TaxID=3198878 RepID=UPI00315852ED